MSADTVPSVATGSAVESAGSFLDDVAEVARLLGAFTVGMAGRPLVGRAAGASSDSAEKNTSTGRCAGREARFDEVGPAFVADVAFLPVAAVDFPACVVRPAVFRCEADGAGSLDSPGVSVVAVLRVDVVVASAAAAAFGPLFTGTAESLGEEASAFSSGASTVLWIRAPRPRPRPPRRLVFNGSSCSEWVWDQCR